MDQLDQLVAQAGVDFAAAADSAALETAKARYLGKGGSLTELLKGLGKLDPEARKTAGAEINKAKSAIEAQLNACRDALQQAALEAQLAAEALDVTLPGRGAGIGGLHPVVRTLERVEQLFRSIGFDVAEGPEIETDFYNFTALNTPANHPARSMHDTFYLQNPDGTVADKVEVNGGFLRKPEGKDFGYVGADQYDVKYYGEGIGIALRKGQGDLKQQLNDAIDTIRANGTYEKIAKKYFDFDPYGKD